MKITPGNPCLRPNVNVFKTSFLRVVRLQVFLRLATVGPGFAASFSLRAPDPGALKRAEMEFGWPFLHPSGPKRAFPSPQPSPNGRGRVFLRRSAKPIPSAISQTGQNCSLSRWERAGVRGILAHLISTGSGVLSLMLALVLSAPATGCAADTGSTFATPDEAVAALAAAVNANDTNALREIFGPALANIRNPDRVQAANSLQTFATAFDATNQLVQESNTRRVLDVGTNDWPFPIPLVKGLEGQWFFDTKAGEEEILNRRIGRNELDTLQTVRAYVDAQREYASRDRDGGGVLKYAQRLFSSPGTQDGLYWPPDLIGEISPLGPLVANAQGEGYWTKDTIGGPQPYHGYLFKILTRQGKHAPGGKYNYIINGNMIGGFALAAWPAEYGNTGIMTFIVNQQGRVYQKDLGEKTGKLAGAMKQYDPNPTWRLSPD